MNVPIYEVRYADNSREKHAGLDSLPERFNNPENS